MGLPIALLLGLGAHPILSNWLGGRAPDAETVIERFYAISVERRIKHPAVAAITEAARERIFKRD